MQLRDFAQLRNHDWETFRDLTIQFFIKINTDASTRLAQPLPL
jgi:hypothetical protein